MLVDTLDDKDETDGVVKSGVVLGSSSGVVVVSTGPVDEGSIDGKVESMDGIVDSKDGNVDPVSEDFSRTISGLKTI